MLSLPVLDGKPSRLLYLRSRTELPATLFHFPVHSSIGLESALLFAQEGADVLLVDVTLPTAEESLALIQERFPDVKAMALKADVGKEADVKAAVDKAIRLFGRLDVKVRVYLFLLLPHLLYRRPVPCARPPRTRGVRACSSALHANPLTRRAVQQLLLSLAPPTLPVSSTARAPVQLRARLPFPCHA